MSKWEMLAFKQVNDDCEGLQSLSTTSAYLNASENDRQKMRDGFINDNRLEFNKHEANKNVNYSHACYLLQEYYDHNYSNLDEKHELEGLIAAHKHYADPIHLALIENQERKLKEITNDKEIYQNK